MSHHDTHHDSHDSHDSHGHVTALSVYHGIFAALLVLTFITVAISRVDFGAANTLIAMFVATINASLVALFFMHLLHDEKLNVITFTFSLLFVALFFLFPLVDITSRGRIDDLTDTYSLEKENKKIEAHKQFLKDNPKWDQANKDRINHFMGVEAGQK